MSCKACFRSVWALVVAGFGVLGACGSDETGAGGQGAAPTAGSAGSGGAATGGTHQGAAGAGASGAAGGSGGAAACDDTFNGEPNDDPAGAVNLLVVSDNDPDPWPSLDGVIVDAGDVDWYTFLGTDELAAYVDPELVFDPSSTDLKLCAYFWCVAAGAWGPPEIGAGGAGGGPAHTCPPGTETDVLDLSAVEHAGVLMGDAPGCCTVEGTGTFHLGEDFFTNFWAPFSCDGLTDDMKVLISVSPHHGAEAPDCEPYAVDYHY